MRASPAKKKTIDEKDNFIEGRMATLLNSMVLLISSVVYTLERHVKNEDLRVENGNIISEYRKILTVHTVSE